MANIHTGYPRKVVGESNLARQLAAIEDPRLQQADTAGSRQQGPLLGRAIHVMLQLQNYV